LSRAPDALLVPNSDTPTIAHRSLHDALPICQTFDNQTGGAITETGSAQVVVNSGTFKHHGGTITGPAGPDVVLNSSSLAISTANAGNHTSHVQSHLSRDRSPAQDLTLAGNCA